MEYCSSIKDLFIETLSWLTANPGVFAALVALIGVMVSTLIGYIGVSRTIEATDERDAKKLDADIRQKDKEREIALRKEVYMEAASGMVSARKYLAQIVDRDNLDRHSIDQLDKFFAAVAKIDVVGTNDTIEKIDAVMRQFNESHCTLLFEASQLDAMENELRVLKEEVEFNYDTYNRITELIRSGQTQLNSDHLKIHHDIVALGQKISNLEKTLPNTRESFQKKCMTEALKMASLIYPAVIAIRSELHLTIDSQRYATLKLMSLEKAKNDFDKFVSDLNSGLNSS